ncbi:MAG: MGMT family protein [Candidatus Omnitrophota bacterium]
MKKPQKISLNIGKSIDIILKDMTAFERAVLKVTCSILPGQVRTYKWVARKIGCPNAQRAVGQALKKNPLPLLIPCHRVISASGKIGGYAYGKETKKILLDFEQGLITNRKKDCKKLSKKIRSVYERNNSSCRPGYTLVSNYKRCIKTITACL